MRKNILAFTFTLVGLMSNLVYASCIENITEITKCAKDGNQTAQGILGLMYFNGNEIPKNYKEYFKWTSLAAQQGSKSSQIELGFAYYNGWGTPQNKVMAYAWWSLGSIGSEQPLIQTNIRNLEKELTKNELDKAQQIALKCNNSKFKQCN